MDIKDYLAKLDVPTVGRAQQVWRMLEERFAGRLQIPDVVSGNQGQVLFTWEKHQPARYCDLEVFQDHTELFTVSAAAGARDVDVVFDETVPPEVVAALEAFRT